MGRLGYGFGSGRHRRPGTPPPWTPAALFAASPATAGYWYEARDVSTLRSDLSGTPAVVGGRVALRTDKSGHSATQIQPTASQQPYLRQDGSGGYYLEYDGIDDCYYSGIIDFSGSDGITMAAAFIGTSDASTGLIAEHGPVGDVRSALVSPRAGTANWGWQASDGTAVVDQQANRAAAPVKGVLIGRGEVSSKRYAFWANGRAVSGSATLANTGWANYPLWCGRRSNGAATYRGYDYALIGINRYITDAELLALSAYLNSIVGAY